MRLHVRFGSVVKKVKEWKFVQKQAGGEFNLSFVMKELNCLEKLHF